MRRTTTGLLSLVMTACASAGVAAKPEGSGAPTSASATASAVSIDGRVIGTAHPLVLQAISPAGTWISYCQARRDTDGDGVIQVGVGYHGDTHGDALEPFIDIAGRELTIEAFVAGSPDGRWVALLRGGALELHDTRSGEVRALAADARDDANPYGGHRAASFDAASRQILTVGDRSRGEALVVRALETGEETRISAEGEIWRAWIDAGGRHVWAWVVTRDTDGDGQIGLPRVVTTLAARRCRGPVAVSSSHGYVGDAPELMLAPIVQGERLVPTPGALGLLGDVLVARREDGALEARGDGGVRVIAPPDCAADVLYADPAAARIAFVCRGREVVDGGSTVWAPLYFDDRGRVVDSGEMATPAGEDHFETTYRRWRARGERPYDLALGRFAAAEPDSGDLKLGGEAPRSLYRTRSGALYVWNEYTGERTPISARLSVDEGLLTPVREAGEMLSVAVDRRRDLVIDLASATVRGSVPGHALALTVYGDALLGVRLPSGVLLGPLRWSTPRPDASAVASSPEPARRALTTRRHRLR